MNIQDKLTELVDIYTDGNGQSWSVTNGHLLIADMRDQMRAILRRIKPGYYAQLAASERTATTRQQQIELLGDLFAALCPDEGAEEHPIARALRHQSTDLLAVVAPNEHAAYREQKYHGGGDAATNRKAAMRIVAESLGDRFLIPGF